MANAQKISELTTAGQLTGAELVPVVQNGGTVQTNVGAMALYATSALQTNIDTVSAHVDQVSALANSNVAAITSVQADVSTLYIRVDAVSAANTAIAAAIASTNNVVSVLEVRVSAVSAAVVSVNAVVSTKVNRVGDYMDNVQYIEFDTSTSYAVSSGRMTWGIDGGTVDIGLDSGPVVLQVGLQLYQRVFNNNASTLTKGQVVKITGSSGQRLTAAPAQANADTNSLTTFAVMAENVSVNAQGYAMTEGTLHNVDTQGFADGTTLWLSPTTAGAYTATKPEAPDHLVLVGFVVKGGSVGGGSIYVKIINGFELGELHDVKVSSSTSLVNGEILAYDTSAHVWTNSMALINTQASVSVLQLQVDSVSAAVSANAARIAAVSASVSVLQVQLNAVSAALTSTNNVVSALEVRVSAVSAGYVTNAAAITSVNNVVSVLDLRVAAVSASVSALQVQLNDVSAALTSTNNVVSALEVRVSAASATGVFNAASITSINNVVSVLDLRVAAVSAATAANTASIVSINNSGGGGGGISWTIVSTSYTAASGNWLFCDTSSSAISITLPSTPSASNYVAIASGANASNKNITVNRNGNTIMALAENMTISTPNVSFQLVYDGSTWRLA